MVRDCTVLLQGPLVHIPNVLTNVFNAPPKGGACRAMWLPIATFTFERRDLRPSAMRFACTI